MKTKKVLALVFERYVIGDPVTVLPCSSLAREHLSIYFEMVWDVEGASRVLHGEQDIHVLIGTHRNGGWATLDGG